MALAAHYATAALNAKANAQAALLNAGFLDLYDGTQPPSANSAVTTQTRLVRLAFSNPAFSAASAGSVTSIAITPALADAAGTASWFRAVQADGTAVVDGSVGMTGNGTFNLELNTTTVTVGVSVSVNSLTLSESAG